MVRQGGSYRDQRAAGHVDIADSQNLADAPTQTGDHPQFDESWLSAAPFIEDPAAREAGFQVVERTVAKALRN